MELLRIDGAGVPSTRTINRVPVRQGLVESRSRQRPRDSYRQWQRPGPMQLWQLDIVGGVMFVETATGVVREAKVVTGVDDHSRFCVLAHVTERATGRAVCLGLPAALSRFGVPEEVLTDNCKQFTDRFEKGGEALFDKICRKNGIGHRLTQPASPTTTGKIERFHLTLRREPLDDHEPFTSIEAAQAALDAWVADDNTVCPHQALETEVPQRRRKTKPWSVEEARRFLESAKNDRDPMYAAYVLILVLGLRRGEALGLTRPEVDLDRGELTVSHSLARVNGRLLLGETNDRRVRCTPSRTGYLWSCFAPSRDRSERRQGSTQGSLAGPARPGLHDPLRRPIDPRNFVRSFKNRCARAGVRPIRVHDTRHTCGSLLAALDVHARVAMQILRHSKIDVTMEIYTHVPSELTQAASKKLGQSLDGIAS